jgi:hypothetical protein
VLFKIFIRKTMCDITIEKILSLPEENKKNIAYILTELLQYCMPKEKAPMPEIIDACCAGFFHWKEIPESDFCIMIDILRKQMGEMVEMILSLPQNVLEDLIEITITTNWAVFENML